LPDDGESWVVQIQGESHLTREIYVPCWPAPEQKITIRHR
jgi:hypothetical protein